MRKIFIDNSTFIEGVCELADRVVQEKYGEDRHVEEGDSTKYSEEAQDFFNEVYDEVETNLNNILNVYSTEDKNNTALSTLSESTVKKLQNAQDKITLDMLDNLEYGEEIRLNDLFVLYHYTEDEIVVLNLAIDDEWEEILQLQWDDVGNIEFEAL